MSLMLVIRMCILISNKLCVCVCLHLTTSHFSIGRPLPRPDSWSTLKSEVLLSIWPLLSDKCTGILQVQATRSINVWVTDTVAKHLSQDGLRAQSSVLLSPPRAYHSSIAYTGTVLWRLFSRIALIHIRPPVLPSWIMSVNFLSKSRFLTGIYQH